MDKASVIKLRKMYENKKVIIFGDNMIITTDDSYIPEDDQNPRAVKTSFIIWDDENELLFCLQPNCSADYGSQRRYPYSITSTTYENIQYFKLIASKDDFNTFLEEQKAAGNINETKYNEILNNITDITNY